MSSCVLVTGGSGALGSAIVRRFRAGDSMVAFTYNSHGEAAQALSAETGAHPLRADLTDAAQTQAAVAEALDYLGQLDVLVNNAGLTQVMPFALIEEQDWDEVVGANLKMLFLTTQAAARHMVARESGAIINIGSIAAHRMLDVPVHYATAKAAVSGFTISLAAELRRYAIRVNSVVPGLLGAGIARNVPEREYEEYMRHCAAGRPGKLEEVAELVYFLAGEKAAYINAQNILIDGGL